MCPNGNIDWWSVSGSAFFGAAAGTYTGFTLGAGSAVQQIAASAALGGTFGLYAGAAWGILQYMSTRDNRSKEECERCEM